VTLLQIVGSEFTVTFTALQNVIADDEQSMRDRHQRPFQSAAGSQTFELCCQVAVFRSTRRPTQLGKASAATICCRRGSCRISACRCFRDCLDTVPPHELHSSKLEYLGVVAGIKSWCKKFSERQRMEIDFNNEESSTLPFEIGLCLFRVIQEALHNAQKHRGVKRIEVQLREDSGEIHLIIRDPAEVSTSSQHRKERGLVSPACANAFGWCMERFPLNPNRWVELLSMFAYRLGRSTPPSERQFKHHVRLCVPHRLVRALRCFPHSQT